MKKKIMALVLALCLVGMMAACGSDDTSAVSENPEEVLSSEEASAEEASSAEESAVEESAVEESAVEEEEEPTEDELFQQFTKKAEGICMMLQVYDQRGTPIHNGSMTIEADGKSTLVDLDDTGTAFLSDLTAGTEYELTFFDSDGNQAGAVPMTISEEEEYGGALSEDGVLELAVADGDTSLVDIAITATVYGDENSRFDCSRIDAWAGVTED